MFGRHHLHQFQEFHGHGGHHLASGRGHGGWFGGHGRHRPEGGRGPFGRGGGGGGRVFGAGDLRLVLLGLIEEKPRHGYELIKALEQKFGGGYAPSPGSVYPTLTLLEELGYVRSSTTEGTKRLFEITDEGRAYLRENAPALNSALARMEMAARAFSGDSPPDDVAPRDAHPEGRTDVPSRRLGCRGDRARAQADRRRGECDLAGAFP